MNKITKIVFLILIQLSSNFLLQNLKADNFAIEVDFEDFEDLDWCDPLQNYYDESCENELYGGFFPLVQSFVDDENETSSSEDGGPTEENPEKKDHGILYDKYLCNGELDAPLICKKIFPLMSPEQINESFRDVRKFIKNYSRETLCEDKKRIGEIFLRDILHVYGHIFTFAQNARVDLKTNRVFVPEINDRLTGTCPLVDYWWFLEQETGLKLHLCKFYASCIDYLTVMIHAYMTFPCFDKKQLNEMDDRWLWWLEKVTNKLDGDPVFGGYYQENAKLFREVFSLWKGDFDAKKEMRKKLKKFKNWGTF